MNNTYDEILKIWNMETPDDFAIFSELYYEMFGEEGIPTPQIPQNLLLSFRLHEHFDSQSNALDEGQRIQLDGDL